MKFTIQFFTVFIILLFSTQVTYGQSGKIAGKVTDASTGAAP